MKKVKASDLLFYLSYIVFLVLSLVSTTFWFQYISGTVNNTVKICCILLLIIKELNAGKVTKSSIYGIFVCILISCLLFIVDSTQRNNYICLIIFLYAARNIDFDGIAKITIKVSISFLIITIFSSQVGIVNNYVDLLGGRERQFLGFLYALYPPTIYLNILLLIFYLRKQKIRWLEILLFSMISYWLYLKTDSRLPFALSVCVIFFMAVMKYRPDMLVREKKIRFLLSFSFALFGAASIILLLLYTSGSFFATAINSIMENRIALAYDAFSQYGISLFGNKFDMIGNGLNIYGENTSQLYLKYTYIDNLYLQLLLRYGAVFFALIIVFFTLMSIRIAKVEIDGRLSIVMFILSSQALVQDCFLSIISNTFIFLVGVYLMTSLCKLSKVYVNKISKKNLYTKKGARNGL